MSKPSSPEVPGIEGMIGLFKLFQVSDTRRTASPNDLDLQEAISNIAQAAAAIVLKASQIQKLTNDGGVFSAEAVAEVCLLRKQAKKLPNVANTFALEAERTITTKILKLGGYRDSRLADLTSYFYPQILEITREVLKSTLDGVGVLWKIAEECYTQAMRKSGSLYPDDDFFTRGGVAQLPEGTAKFSAELTRSDWVRFWIKVLQACPEGPTLFYPPASTIEEYLDDGFTKVPPYLFRVFDSNSSGVNNQNVISSSMQESGMLQRSKVDILSLEAREGTEMLYNHLNKGQFNAAPIDNLMSWSSSLLFVIQYAIWRSFHGGLPSDRIWICAVDTAKFPAGQFAHDMKLLRLYETQMNQSTPQQQFKFFQFRLNKGEYNNGEYLSQGKLNIRHRSHIFSLQDLMEAGLCRLYPEFADSQGQSQWSNRVKSLRHSWYFPVPTYTPDIENASKIAKECFGGLNVAQIALMLLGFRNRETAVEKYGIIKEEDEDEDSAGPCEPIEVRRYDRLAKTFEQVLETLNQADMDGTQCELPPSIIHAIFGGH